MKKLVIVGAAIVIGLFVAVVYCFWAAPWLRPEWTWTHRDVEQLRAESKPAAQAFMQSDSYVREFIGTFSDCQHTLELNPVYHDTPLWTSSAKVLGRYHVRMYFTVDLDYSQHTLARSSRPKFSVTEYTGGTKLANGSYSLECGKIVHFGVPKWRTLVDQSGDLRAMGVDVITDQHVPVFDAWWRQLPGLETVVYDR